MHSNSCPVTVLRRVVCKSTICIPASQLHQNQLSANRGRKWTEEGAYLETLRGFAIKRLESCLMRVHRISEFSMPVGISALQERFREDHDFSKPALSCLQPSREKAK